jgi:hypothetical protein
MTTPPPSVESLPNFGSDEAAKLYWLTETPGRAFIYLREVSETISSLFGKATSAAQRDTLLHLFFATMGVVDGMVTRGNPGFLEEFRNANKQNLKIYWFQESTVDGNIDGKTLVAVSRREKARSRMAANGDPIPPGAPPGPHISDQDLDRLNADIDQERREAMAGRVPQPGSKRVLLYRVPAFPQRVAVSKVEPPVEAGAFFFDCNRPLQVTKSFFGKRNTQLGTAIELRAPVIHQGQSASDADRFIITVDRRDPQFSQIIRLWKDSPATVATSTSTAVSGLKLLVDFYTQFPDE